MDLTTALARIAALEAENTTLKRRIAEIEALDTSPKSSPTTTDGKADNLSKLLYALVERSPSDIFVKDRNGRYVFINQRFEEDCAVTREGLYGSTDHAWVPAHIADLVRVQDQKIIEDGVPVQFEEIIPVRGQDKVYFTIKFPLFDEDNNLLGLCGIATDITEAKRIERERDAMREQMLAAQLEALRELSTPLMPIADGVLAMPLVGAIDDARAGRIMDTLLEGISRQSAHTAILDITGVRSVDAQVADALVAAARAAKLLGARVLLSGVRPDVARTLVDLGADLGGITTVPTLQSAIAIVLGQRQRASY